jgi:tetratricopeptide (TPR) repeat protein
LQQALRISRELGDREFEATSLSDLGDAYLGLNQISDAVDCHQESLAIRRGIADPYGQATTLRSLARSSQRSGDTGQAMELLTEALRLYEELEDHAEASEVRASLAEITKAAG